MSQRRYGHFTCSKCGKRWESSHVYCDDSSCYQQDCMSCRTPSQPRRVEPIVCSQCKQTRCTCTQEDGKKNRNVNPFKAHRSDLCEKCKSGKPCTR